MSDCQYVAHLLETTKDGEWGSGTASDDTEPMHVIRGTDFEKVRLGDLSGVPIRRIPKKLRSEKLSSRAIF
jgi:hypothetical protein